MYNINSKEDKPDIGYMVNRVKESMNVGIKLGDVGSLYSRFLGVQNEIGNKIIEEYGIQNPNSGVQVIEFLKRQKNVDIYEVCCVGDKWTSNKDALLQLRNMGYDFADNILDYRKMKKYAESIKSMLDAVDKDGLVRPNLTLGKTNRINYVNPALMNIPKKLLWHIITPRNEGNVLFSIDIKNQEPSILINLLNIEQLKDALISEDGLYESLFKKPFVQRTRLNIFNTVDKKMRRVSAKEMAANSNIPPIYYVPIRPTVDSVYYNGERIKLIEVCNVVSRIGKEPLLPDKVSIETVENNIYNVDVEWDKLSKRQLNKSGVIEIDGTLKGIDIVCEGTFRDEFKQAWNALTYGASSMGLRKICKGIDGGLIYKYFSGIKEFREYKKQCKKLAGKGIQEINTIFGTKLYAGEKNTNRLQRILMDLPIQGTGSDILALLIKHFDNEVEHRGLVGKLELYYTRHDEFIVEVNKEWLDTVGENKVEDILRDILEHKIDDWIPFKIEVSKIEVKPLNVLNEKDYTDEIFED